MNGGVIPTVQAWDELRREVRQNKLELANLRRRMAEFGVRRNQVTYMPSKRVIYSIQCNGFEVTTDTLTQLSPVTDSDLTSSNAFSLASGIVTIVKPAQYHIEMQVIGRTPFQQNDFTELAITLQYRGTSSDPWGAFGVGYSVTTYHPNVALVGVSPTNAFTGRASLGLHGTVAGGQYRLISEVLDYGSSVPISTISVRASWLYG